MQLATDEYKEAAPVEIFVDEPEYVFHDPAFVPKVSGFVNTGVSCWWNSLVQTMLSISSINKVLIRAKYNLRDNHFAQSYINLVEQMLAGQVINDISPLLEAFNAELRRRGMRTLASGQQCANEGYALFIEALGCPEVENLCRSVYECKIKCSTCGHETMIMRDEAVSINMFVPSTAVNVPQFCNAIRNVITETDAATCNMCNTVSTASRRIDKLKVLREVVIITFNKYFAKVNRYYPSELIFPSFGKHLKYALVGKIEHSGDRYSGHYWAHVERHGSITCVNDFSTSTGNFTPTAQTFMLAYVLTEYA